MSGYHSLERSLFIVFVVVRHRHNFIHLDQQLVHMDSLMFVFICYFFFFGFLGFFWVFLLFFFFGGGVGAESFFIQIETNTLAKH